MPPLELPALPAPMLLSELLPLVPAPMLPPEESALDDDPVLPLPAASEELLDPALPAGLLLELLDSALTPNEANDADIANTNKIRFFI